jgi:hypothetical protein
MTDRKKPGVAFWATVAVAVVLAAYPLSFGPVRYAYWKNDRPAWMGKAAGMFFWPHFWMHEHGPQWLSRAISGYDDWWFRPPVLQ